MQLKSVMNLAHINWRRLKAGDRDSPLFFDLKFKGDLKPEEIEGLFTTAAQYQKLLSNRWDKDGDLTIADASVMPLDVEALGCTLELKTEISKDVQRWTEGDVDQITLHIKPGRLVAVEMRVRVRPTKQQVPIFWDWYSCDLEVSFWSRQHDLDLEEKSGKKAEKSLQRDILDEQESPKPKKGKKVEALEGPKAADNAPLVPGQKAPQRPRSAKTH